MSRWLVVQDSLGAIPSPFISGKSGVDAIEQHLPDHMIGKVRRRREWEQPDFILQRVIQRAGETFKSGPECGYKYHKPVITRIT